MASTLPPPTFKYCIGNRSATNRDQSPTHYDCRRCPNDVLRLCSHRKSGITRRLSGTVADCLKTMCEPGLTGAETSQQKKMH